MNLYCTMVFVINMPSIMSMIVTIIPHGIPMMDVHLMLMILIKTNPQKVWEVLKIDPVINQLNKDFTTQIQKAIAQPSRSQSSLDSIQVTRKSSKELKDLAKQLLLQSKQLKSKEKVLLPLQKLQLTTVQTIHYSRTLRILMMVTIWIVIESPE